MSKESRKRMADFRMEAQIKNADPARPATKAEIRAARARAYENYTRMLTLHDQLASMLIVEDTNPTLSERLAAAKRVLAEIRLLLVARRDDHDNMYGNLEMSAPEHVRRTDDAT